MIQKLRMHTLRNNEFLRFHKDLLTIVTQNNPATLNVVTQASTYSGKILEMEGIYKMETSNPMTAEIEELDHQRDEIITGIINLLKGFSSHFSPEIKDCAILLQRDLEKYGTAITKENYGSETTDIENIIADWSAKPELQNAVDMLGILDWVIELERVNLLFNSKWIARTNSYAAQTGETTKGKRAEVTTAYDTLCKYLNSYSFINDIPEYRLTISEINALTEQFSILLKQRKGKTAAAKKVADTPL